MSQTMTDDEVIQSRDDLEMLKRSHLWPSVIKGHRCVFVKNDNGHTGPCFKIHSGYAVIDHDWDQWSEGEGKGITAREYNSAEAVVAAGWVVD